MSNEFELCEAAVNLMQKGDLRNAVGAFDQVLIKDPNVALAWANRAMCLKMLGHPFDAVVNMDRAIALKPKVAEYYSNRGASKFDYEDMDGAQSDYRQALAVNPNLPVAHMNMGNVLKYKGKIEEAIPYYRAAIKASPDYVDAHLNLSFALLTMGNYEEGWREFEWRWKSGQLPPRGLPFPQWKGEDLKGKRLFIYGEQGHGDVLQFMRYAPLIKERYPSARVFIEVKSPLTRIARTMLGIDGVVTYGEKIPEGIDFTIPMMACPGVMGTRVETIPASKAYLYANPIRAGMFKKRMTEGGVTGLRAGLCWAGMSRPNNQYAQAVDRKRSTSLQTFALPALVKGITWVSLQKGPAAIQPGNVPYGMRIYDAVDELDDFADTAALIDCLDLVITVDTAVAHLAAALGKPTWVISRWDGCWRWLGHRSDSPWYPTVRQFWQKAPDDWGSAMKDVLEALRKYVAEHNAKAA